MFRDNDFRSAVTPAYRVDRISAYYPMNHQHRGKAIIFAHSHFDDATDGGNDEPLTNRDGNEVDCDKLVKSLEKLQFDVTLYQDQRLQVIHRITQEVSSMDHSNNDCLLIAILSHGEEGDIVHAFDGPYQLSTIWKPFTADKCRTLAGKPKILLVQACRGSELDSAVETDGHGTAIYNIPANADFLFAFATIPGFAAFRNSERGSWFIQELCRELDENGQRYDILTLLTFVIQTVAYRYQVLGRNNPALYLKKQIPCFTSRLTRLLMFNNI